MLSNMSVPGLISEKIRLKSRIQSRNYLLGEFRRIVKRENERDSHRIAEIEEFLKAKGNNKSIFKTFILF
jgi:hypothetical protein